MWEARYATDTYVYGTDPNDFLRESLTQLPTGPALRLAEGEGRNAVFLAKSGFEVHSVDLTEAGVAKTRRLAQDRGVQVHASVGDLATFDIGVERWDLIVSIFAHMPATVRRDPQQRAAVALKPGGLLVLEAYTPDQSGRGTGGPTSPRRR